ncbi:MAG TPA: hypothetical protein VF240_16640 [Pyrinomonadaceae bacterium]
MKTLFVIVVFFCCLLPAAAAQSPSSAHAEELPRGQIIERLAARDDPSQSYALYLPSHYSTNRAWPILYCFDPLGRGSVPVERFREAAEKYGWIVVGSNNSRNGPLAPSVAAARAVWADTRARLSIDDRRLYAAGFSGGARHAVRVNQLCQNCLAGVIACGAGFPPDIDPSASSRFALFGMAGADDFNFPELKLLDERLARLGFPHRLEVFDGGHSWAPAHVCTKAVEWMELQAMRAGRRTRDEKLIGELWDKMLAKAVDDEAAGRVYDAWVAYRSLAEDFEGLRDVAGEAGRAARLGESKEVRRALDEEGAQIRRQQNLFDRIRALHESRSGAEEPAVVLMEFRRAVAALGKAAGAGGDTGERRVARRTLRQLFAHYYESAANLRDRGVESGRVVSHLEVAAEIIPDNPQVLFELASAYAVNREKKKALTTLRKSVESGFTDADAVAGNESLAPLRDEAAFKEIVERLREKP